MDRKVILESARLQLKPITMLNFNLFYRLHTDQAVIKYCFDAQSEALVKQRLLACWSGKGSFANKRVVFVVNDKFSGEQVGVTGFFKAGENYEVGYLLLPEFFAMGYATESLKLVVDFAKNNQITRLNATVTKGNDASIAVLKKLGFEYVGEKKLAYEIAGELRDDVYYSLDLY